MKTKIVIFIVLLATIINQRNAWIFQRCDYQIALLSINPIIWYEQTIDGQNQRHLVTRFLHNKAGIYMAQFAKCYFEAIDPFLLYKLTGIAGLFSLLYLIYKLVDLKRYNLILLIFFLPILPFLKSPVYLQIFIYKLIAASGLFYFLKNLKR